MRGVIGKDVVLEERDCECGFEGAVDGFEFRDYISWECPACTAIHEEERDD